MNMNTSLKTFLSFLLSTALIVLFLFLTQPTFAATSAEAAKDCGIDNSMFNNAGDFKSSSSKDNFPACATVETGDLGFQIPSLSPIRRPIASRIESRISNCESASTFPG